MSVPSRAALAALGAHALPLADTSRPKGRWETPAGAMPWVVLSPEVSAFLATAQAHGWVSAEVDWMAWRASDEGRLMLSDRTALTMATATQLRAIITSVVRGDRFSEGTILEAATSGLLAAVAARARALAG